MTTGERAADRGDAEVAFRGASIWSADGTQAKGNDYADTSAEDGAWAEALRTGSPLKAPPGYEIVEEEVGVVGPGGKLLRTGGGS